MRGASPGLQPSGEFKENGRPPVAWVPVRGVNGIRKNPCDRRRFTSIGSSRQPSRLRLFAGSCGPGFSGPPAAPDEETNGSEDQQDNADPDQEVQRRNQPPSEEEQNRKDHCDDEKNVHDRYLPFSLKCSTMAPPPGLARRVHGNPGLPAPDDRAWATARLGNVTGDPGVQAGVVPHFVLRYRIMLTLQLFTRWRELHRGSEQQPSQVVCPPWWGLLWPLAGRFYPGPVP